MFIRPSGAVTGSINYAELPSDHPLAQGRSEEGVVEESAAPESETEPEPEAESEAPKDYATKGEWVDYAVTQGADRSEAESLTKQELIDLYGG